MYTTLKTTSCSKYLESGHVLSRAKCWKVFISIIAVGKSLQRFLPRPYPSQSTDLPSRNLTGKVGNLWYSPKLRLISRDPLGTLKDEIPPFQPLDVVKSRGRVELNVYDKEVMLLCIWNPLFLYVRLCLLMEIRHCSQTSSLRNTR